MRGETICHGPDCNVRIAQPLTGRRRRFHADACRQAAYRRRKDGGPDASAPGGPGRSTLRNAEEIPLPFVPLWIPEPEPATFVDDHRDRRRHKSDEPYQRTKAIRRDLRRSLLRCWRDDDTVETVAERRGLDATAVWDAIRDRVLAVEWLYLDVHPSENYAALGVSAGFIRYVISRLDPKRVEDYRRWKGLVTPDDQRVLEEAT